ncbi:hypothetical protein OVA24_17540 [Luteolibacter sp. SL250]|uniref:hypothetical protein n=1 Tax=Luteolibacter sp. SL250 TaxID=2995170 RepID=UPI0022711AAF|nr:hypothetical protein [Luteolibacter sp. SL250]WAC19033.1 hypothetical protein OVA24_17540 [Luteolibacter sp. SL250]
MNEERVLTWEVWANSGHGSLDDCGEELWVFYSEEEAKEALPSLRQRNEKLHTWRIEPHRREREFIGSFHQVLLPEPVGGTISEEMSISAS